VWSLYNEEFMNHEEKMEALRGIFDHCLEVADAKGHDYSGTEDAMSNFHDFGWQGIIVRIGDKYHRVKNFCKKAVLKVKDESVEDTLYDLITYAALALIMYWGEKRNASGKA
jgi:hypothetical protein